MAEIEFQDVTFLRGESSILEVLSFHVGRGEILTLIGRSGAGKTTVLKLCNGLLLPAHGRVLVGGRDTRAWEPYQLRRHAGYVLQEIGLFPHMTIEENVGIVPRLLAWPPDRIRARARDVLGLVGLPLEEFGRRWPEQLSGGQRQRAGIARALAADPPVLLMDEPFGALDPITRAETRAEFRRIQSAVRKTIVFVTHDMAEALALGDRVGVLDGGRLVGWDAPARIVRSQDPRVRGLVDAAREAISGLDM